GGNGDNEGDGGSECVAHGGGPPLSETPTAEKLTLFSRCVIRRDGQCPDYRWQWPGPGRSPSCARVGQLFPGLRPSATNLWAPPSPVPGRCSTGFQGRRMGAS